MKIANNTVTEEQKKTILIFRIGHLGDTLVAMPAIHAIRKKLPNHNLVLLTEHHSNYISSWEILKPTGWFSDVLFYAATQTVLTKIMSMFTLMVKIRKFNPEYLFDLSPERTISQHFRDRLFFTVLCGISKYAGQRTNITKQKKINVDMSYAEPEWQRLFSIVTDEKNTGFCLPIPEKEKQQALKSLKCLNMLPKSPLFAICPGSNMPAKRWPKERFAEVGKRLTDEYATCNLVIIGGKEDEGLGDELCSILGDRCHNLAGKLSIFESAAVLARCNVYIGNDTGTMHLAAMAGTPCVAIFSARDCPGKWEPYGNGNIIIRDDIECAGCMLNVCELHQMSCLKAISVEQVFSAAKTIISKQREQN